MERATDAVKLLKLALEFLVGNEEDGDTVESCSGGLLGKEVSMILMCIRIYLSDHISKCEHLCQTSFTGLRKKCECDKELLVYQF